MAASVTTVWFAAIGRAPTMIAMVMVLPIVLMCTTLDLSAEMCDVSNSLMTHIQCATLPFALERRDLMFLACLLCCQV